MAALFALAAVALVVAVVVHWGSIRLLYRAATTDAEEIQRRTDTVIEERREFLREQNLTVQLPDREQVRELLDGTVSAETVKRSLGLDEPETAQPEQPGAAAGPEQPSRQPLETPQPTVTPVPSAVPDSNVGQTSREEAAQEAVSQCVRQLNAYEVDLLGQLGAMKQAAIEEYKALPKEQRTQEKKVSIGIRTLSKCYDLEVVADKNVRATLEECRKRLAEVGGDTGVVDALWHQYCQEKESLKSEYLNKYLK